MNFLSGLLSAAGTGDTPNIELVGTWAERVENLMKALQATVIGVVMVFVILGLLIGIIYLTHFLLKISAKKSDNKMIAMPVTDSDENQRIVAAITAAVTMAYETECEEAGVEPVDFVVTNIKRIR